MHPGSVSVATVIAAKSRRCAVPFARVTTRAKRRAVFHLSRRRDFESGQKLLGHNFTDSDHFKKPNTFLFFKKW